MDFFKKYHREAILGVLVFLNIFVWSTFYERRETDLLSVYFLNVGQGDAILIDSPSHQRILIDGGRNRKLLSELGKILPFADRRIDVVIATHPDLDHIGGLPEIVARYNVGLFLESGVKSESTLDLELQKRIEGKKIPRILARRGMVINFGDGVKLQILFPNQSVSNWETNSASVVARLVYGEHSFLLTGDSPSRIENVLLNLNPVLLDSDVLKVGHHGSRTSTSLSFAKAVGPRHAIISADKDNRYGHPHQEVLDILGQVGAQTLSTGELGTIKFKSNGQTLEFK